MLVEFIIDKDDYKKILKNINFTASNGVEVKKRSLKSSGKNNNYLRLTCANGDINSAKALSEIRGTIENDFKGNDFNYHILIDESSQYFSTTLYPLVMEFETKLRKFIHNTLFDISDESTQKIMTQLKTHLKKAGKDQSQIHKVDFLEKSTLEDIRNFLFSNIGLYTAIKEYASKPENHCLTRQSLFDYISKNAPKTLWEDFFEADFSDSVLPQNFSKIIECRNDVMHFHYISFERFTECQKLLQETNSDLDKQIKKGIVIENTSENIDKLSRSTAYWDSLISNSDTLFKEASNTAKIILNSYTPFLNDKGYLENLADLTSSLYKSTIKLPKLDYESLNLSSPILQTLNFPSLDLEDSSSLKLSLNPLKQKDFQSNDTKNDNN